MLEFVDPNVLLGDEERQGEPHSAVFTTQLVKASSSAKRAVVEHINVNAVSSPNAKIPVAQCMRRSHHDQPQNLAWRDGSTWTGQTCRFWMVTMVAASCFGHLRPPMVVKLRQE
jgi:hypothetical protein